MLIRKDAIKAGQAICKAAKRISEENEGAHNDKQRHQARAACAYAMDNLWYEAIPIKVRDTFNIGDAISQSRNAFYVACGWPE